MKYTIRGAACALSVAFLWTASPAAAQPASVELYHIHVSKAAPGKLPQLIEAYQNAPAPDEGEPQVTPIILRHRQGGEWDLMVITPLGKEETITADPPPAPVQESNQQRGPLATWHGDTFVVGPSLETVQKALAPGAASEQAVYVVTDYLSIPGHRAELRKVLEANGQGGESVLFTHVEGASWNFLAIARYDSWADLGAPPPAGQAQGLSAREHMAVHHDTVATYVSGGEAIR
jgi:hypothetical protein